MTSATDRSPRPLGRGELVAKYTAWQRMGNPVRDLHPAAIVTVLVGCVAVAAIGGTPAVSAAVCAAYFVVATAAGVGRVFAKVYGRLALLAGGLLFATRALLLPGSDPWFTAGAVSLSWESIIRGLQFSLLVLALSGAVVLLFTIVPLKRLLASIGPRGLDHRATYVVLSAFQTIVDVGASATTVLDAQRARGVETEGGPIRRMRAFLPVLGPVFLTALAGTEERALAMDARAFNAPGARTRLIRVRPPSALELGASAGVAAALVGAGILIRMGASL